jgi:hypothetical protein
MRGSASAIVAAWIRSLSQPKTSRAAIAAPNQLDAHAVGGRDVSRLRARDAATGSAFMTAQRHLTV